MSDLNNISLIGRIVQEPEMKMNSNGHSWLVVNIANNYHYNRNDDRIEEVNFFRVKIWGKLAESIQQYLVKGKQIGLTGRLHQYKFTNQEKENLNVVEIVANQIQLLSDSRKEQKKTTKNHGKSKQTADEPLD